MTSCINDHSDLPNPSLKMIRELREKVVLNLIVDGFIMNGGKTK